MISVIGAGPAGSYAASLLAKDHDVNLYEEHDQIGVPFQCTGILTSTINGLINIPDKLIVNRLKKVRLYSPKGNNLEIKLKNQDLLIDRIAFDKYLAEIAVKNGAKLHYDHRLMGLEDNKLKFKNGIVESDCIIGADGPLSVVARSSGLFGRREFFLGKQFRTSLKEPMDKDTFEVYFGAAPDFFGWIVPEDENIVRIGIATTQKDVNFYFNKFIKNKIKGDLCECQAGLIPVYNPKIKTSLKTKHYSIYLVGDAATQVKASTAGGIFQGMQAAKYLTEAINYNKDYDSLWKKHLGKELYSHLIIKKILYNFSNEDYEKLFSLLNEDLGKFNRDNVIKSLFSLIIRKPMFPLFIASKAKYLYR